MDLSIVIVNWNVREFVLKCVASIFKHTKNISYEIIVVDNASNDGSANALRDTFRQEIQQGKLLVIQNAQNKGFSKANNQGLYEAQGEYVFFMNPDMEFIENTPLILRDYLKNNPEVGIAACRLLYGDKTIQPTVKNDPTLLSQVFIALKLHHVLSFTPTLKQFLAKSFDYNHPAFVEQVMGACIFMRTADMRYLNGWDEDYWIWWEDIDLCKRIRNKGKKIAYRPETSIIHFEGKSFEQQQSVTKQKRFLKGISLYFKKHHSRIAYGIIKLITPISIFLAFIVQLLKIKPKTQSRI